MMIFSVSSLKTAYFFKKNKMYIFFIYVHFHYETNMVSGVDPRFLLLGRFKPIGWCFFFFIFIFFFFFSFSNYQIFFF